MKRLHPAMAVAKTVFPTKRAAFMIQDPACGLPCLVDEAATYRNRPFMAFRWHFSRAKCEARYYCCDGPHPRAPPCEAAAPMVLDHRDRIGRGDAVLHWPSGACFLAERRARATYHANREPIT